MSGDTAGLTGRLRPDVGPPAFFLGGMEELGFGASSGILVACPWRVWDEGGRVPGVPLLRGVPQALPGDVG